MDTETLKAIRAEIGITQEAMAELIQCDPVGFRRYESGARPVPPYIARSVTLVLFLHRTKALARFKRFVEEDLPT